MTNGFVCDYIKVKHIAPYEFFGTFWNLVLRVSIFFVLQMCKANISIIVKMSKSGGQVSKIRSFKNEVLFYRMLTDTEKVKENFPTCYVADVSWGSLKEMIIVTEDLIAQGYMQLEDKLNQTDLKKYIRLLARFHANMFILRDEKFKIYTKLSSRLIQKQNKKQQNDIIR